MSLSEHDHQAFQNMWQGWLGQLQAGKILDATSQPPSSELNFEACRYLMMMLSHAYLMAFHLDPKYPQFLPFTGEVFNFGGPNPDAVYYFASIDARGMYRIRGKRNNVRFVDLQTGFAMWGFRGAPGETFPSSSLDEFTIEADGSFEILVGTNKPDDYDGNWMPIDPRTDYIMVRQFAYSWQEQDANLAIERLDVTAPKPSLSAAETERRMNDLTEYFNGVVPVYPQMRQTAATGKVNDVGTVAYGVGELARQIYQQGSWDLAPGEMLLAEVKPPESCFYWNTQVNDLFWMTQEMTYRLSSLNGQQAHIDSDGILRVAYAPADPGIPNWIDTGGKAKGDMLWRWLKSSSEPQTRYIRMPMSKLEEYLPDLVTRITGEQRRAQLRQRAVDSQLRRKW